MENIRQIGVISVIVQLQAESKFVLSIMEGKIEVTKSLGLVEVLLHIVKRAKNL